MSLELFEEVKSVIPEGTATAGLLSIIALAFGIIFVVLILAESVRLVLEIAPYAYPNAKVRCKQSLLLGKKRLEAISELDTMMNIANELENTEYIEVIPTEINEKPDPLKIDAFLNQNLMKSYLDVLEFMPGDTKIFFSVYMKKFEIGAIKTVLRGIYSKMPKEKILVLLDPIYKDKFVYLLDSTTIQEMVAKLEKAEYGQVLSSVLQDFEATNSLLILEKALDEYVYKQVMASMTMRPGPDRRTVKKLLGAEIDILNLKIVLRAIASGTTKDISKYIIPHGYELSVFKLKDLSDIKDIERIVGELEGTSFYPALSSALERYRELKSIRVLEKALDEHYIALGKRIATMQPFGIGPMLGYLVSKNAEVQNLAIIIKLKTENFSSEEIKSNMLMV